jgi:hypothetical protein
MEEEISIKRDIVLLSDLFVLLEFFSSVVK